jgi:hypothetical protein
MMKIFRALVSAGLTIATANPALSCGDNSYSPAHHARAATQASDHSKAATQVLPTAAVATSNPAVTLSEADLPDAARDLESL